MKWMSPDLRLPLVNGRWWGKGSNCKVCIYARQIFSHIVDLNVTKVNMFVVSKIHIHNVDWDIILNKFKIFYTLKSHLNEHEFQTAYHEAIRNSQIKSHHCWESNISKGSTTHISCHCNLRNIQFCLQSTKSVHHKSPDSWLEKNWTTKLIITF